MVFQKPIWYFCLGLAENKAETKQRDVHRFQSDGPNLTRLALDDYGSRLYNISSSRAEY